MPDPQPADTAGQDAPSARELYDRLVDLLCRWGVIGDERVADALRTVARHLFMPEAALEVAYARAVVVTRRDVRCHGRPAHIAACPAATPDGLAAGLVLARPRRKGTISWP